MANADRRSASAVAGHSGMLGIPFRQMIPLLNSDRCRALALLAESANGCTEAMMFAHGLAPALLIELIEAGLATTKPDRLHSGLTVGTTRMRITESGLRMLADGRQGRARG